MISLNLFDTNSGAGLKKKEKFIITSCYVQVTEVTMYYSKIEAVRYACMDDHILICVLHCHLQRDYLLV